MSNPFTLRTSTRTWTPIYKADADVDTGGADLMTFHDTALVKPTGDGYVGTDGSNLAKVIVWGSANSGEILTHLASYTRIGHGSYSGHEHTADGIWVPSFICTLQWTFGTLNGIASNFPDNVTYFAKNVELIDGDTSIRLITDTGASGIASVTVDLEGAECFAIGFDDTGVTNPETANAAVGLF